MNRPDLTREQLAQENEQLRQRLEEAEETVRAIRGGEVDAFLIQPAQQEEHVLLLSSAERSYRVLIEEMQQGAVTLVADGAVLYANYRFAHMLGATAEQVVGMPLLTFVPEDQRSLVNNLLKQHAGSHGEMVLRKIDGTHLPVYVTVNPLLDEDRGVCLLFTDLTGQKRQEALVAAETLARSILEQAVDAIVVVDRDGRVIRASRAAHDLCACDPLLQPFAAAFPLECAGAGVLALDAVLQGATIRGVECRLQVDPGVWTELLVSAGPVTDPRGQLLGAVISMTDITSRLHMEKELRHQAQRLAEDDRRKNEFLAVLAHELRNPLAPIRNGVQILNRIGSREPEVVKAREMMGRQVESLVRLVEDLLDVSRITQDKIRLQQEPVDVKAIVLRAVESCRPFIDERGHRLDLVLPDAPLPIVADVVRLSQVLTNLLNNAAKFTAPGGQITVAASILATESPNAKPRTEATSTTNPPSTTQDPESRFVEIQVRDTGVGIPAGKLAQMFELFTQADQTLSRAEGGLGIGLALARRLTELHGGSIEAFSEGPGRGSTFFVRLPLAAAAAPGAVEPVALTTTAQPRHILLVDDNHDSAHSMALLLRQAGHDVRVAHDGAEALAVAAAYAPEIVLLDIGLPGMDGYEVARRLRSSATDHPPVLVALTGYGTDDDRRQARAAGFDHHLVKPVDLNALEQILSRVPAPA